MYSVIDSSYLCQYINSEQGQGFFDQNQIGGGQKNVNAGSLREMPTPLPSFAEQQAIATALTDVDNLINGLDKLIAKKRAMKQGAMQRLLTGKARLPGFEQSGGKVKQTEVGEIPEDWNLKYIGNISSISTGAKNTQDKIDDGLYPFFVRSDKIEKINTFSFFGEAVLTAGDGVGTGKIFHYINGKFDFHQRVYKISDFTEDVHGYFFYLYFSTYFYDRIMSMTAKSSVDSVRLEMIAHMAIPLPSIKEQEVIAENLSNMDEEIIALEKKRDKMRLVKQGMMQELLTGRIRLTPRPP